MIKRLLQKYPKENMPTLKAKIKWFLYGVSISVWEYGTCSGRNARRNKITKNVQFVLWKAGEQGHKKDFWHNFDPSWYELFKKH